MAQLHQAAFADERPWSAAEFDSLLASPHVATFTSPHGFALTRTVAGESELLTLAVDPAHQRHGIGRALTQDWLTSLAGSTTEAFLEVAADNIAAHALYLALDFTKVARRPAYYARQNGASVDAIVMKRKLT